MKQTKGKRISLKWREPEENSMNDKTEKQDDNLGRNKNER